MHVQRSLASRIIALLLVSFVLLLIPGFSFPTDGSRLLGNDDARAQSVAGSETEFGVVMFAIWDDEKDFAQLKEAKARGATMVRIGVSWRLLEPEQNLTSRWYLDRLDFISRSARGLGLKIVAQFAESPCWASSRWATTVPVSGRDCRDANADNFKWYAPIASAHQREFANALALLAGRYGSSGTISRAIVAWEIWNEPDLSLFWRPQPNAVLYTTLLKATHARNPSIALLAGSLAGADTSFLQAMYSAGARGQFQGLALHAYSFPESPESCLNDMRWRIIEGISAIRSTMAANGDGAPIWITEFGWSTDGGVKGVSTLSQAQYLTRAITLIRARTDVQVALWYTLYDDLLANGESHERYFGLLVTPGQPKPAANRFLRRNSVVSNAKRVTVDTKIENGVTFTVPTTGTYDVRILRGVYTTWPEGGQWRTIVYLYQGAVRWGTTGIVQPVSPLRAVGRWEDAAWPTQHRAECAGKGQVVTVNLVANQQYRLVAIDERYRYGDNQGVMTVELDRIP